MNNLQTARTIAAYCTIYRNKVFKNGELIFESTGSAEFFLNAVYEHAAINYPKFYKMDSLCKLGFLAAEFLLQDSDHATRYSDTETGLILSNAQASLDVDLKYAKTIRAGASPALFVYTLPNIVIGEIAIRHHFKGENAFFVFKQFDGNFMADYVNTLFDNQLLKSCICGWVNFLKEDYKASLFLVEQTENDLAFTADHLNELNLLDNG